MFAREPIVGSPAISRTGYGAPAEAQALLQDIQSGRDQALRRRRLTPALPLPHAGSAVLP